jgi:hypothetical protein
MAGVGTAVLAILLTVSCNEAPAQPSRPGLTAQPGTPAPLSQTSLSGTVFEVTSDSVRPLAGAEVVAAHGYSTSSASHGVSGSGGRYELTGLPDLGGGRSPLQSLVAWKEGYSQPCRPTIDDWLAAEVDDVNVYLVANEILATIGVPSLLPLSEPVVSGTVFERSASGGDPVAGANVSVDFSRYYWRRHGAFHLPGSGPFTVTDSAGRYTLCGLTQPYRPFWDEGGVDFPEGSAYVRVSRPVVDAPVTIVPVDVRTVTQLDIEVD